MNGIGGFGGRRLAEMLGPYGVWSWSLQRLSADRGRAAARRIEAAGYGACWIPESAGNKELFSHASVLLAATPRLPIGAGVANIHARDPMAMANAARTLGEAYPGRFILGLGVSHAPVVAMRGGTYSRPVTQMSNYLDKMAEVDFGAPLPIPPVPLVLAALRPRMLSLAAERADGAHSYFVPLEHTALARRVLGSEACLIVEQTAVLAVTPAEGKRVARAIARLYLSLPNYTDALRHLGWTEADLTDGGTDRLLKAVVPWGDATAIAAHVRAQLDAGADHVCVQLRGTSPDDPMLDELAELASLLDR